MKDDTTATRRPISLTGVFGLAALAEWNRRVASYMVAIGVTPCVAALVLFWWPPFLLLGLFSLAVMIAALIDAEKHRATPTT